MTVLKSDYLLKTFIKTRILFSDSIVRSLDYVGVTIIIQFVVLRITGNGLLMKQIYYNVAGVIIILRIIYILL